VGRMKVMAVLAALLLVALAGPAAAEPAKSRLDRILQEGVLRVGTTGDYNPMSFRDPASKELAGHDVDAARQLAEDMGVKLEFVITDWKTLVNGIIADKYDIAMTGSSMSVARAKTAGFTIPWGTNAFFPLVLKKNADKYKGWDDINKPEVTVGFNLGTTMEQFVQASLPKAAVKRVESPARDWQELLAGRVDFTITSLIEGSALVRQNPELTMLFLDRPRNSIPMAFVVPIDDQVWINFVNNWIIVRKQNGYFDALAEKWGLVAK